MKKKYIIYILIINMMLLLANVDMSYSKNNLNIGDVITFGQMNSSEPILWEVISFDDEGDPLLFCKNILFYLAFDISESGEYGKNIENNFTTNADRSMYGSNRWSNSTIREWLNSENPASLVEYSTQKPSIVTIKTSGNYSDGFLYSCFSQAERKFIKNSETRTLVHPLDSGKNIADYEIVNDKVFLLSKNQIKEYVVDNGLNPMRTPLKTSYNQKNSSWLKQKVALEEPWRYWLRTPYGDYSGNYNLESAANYHPHKVLIVGENQSDKVENYYLLSTGYAGDGLIGIVPAMYVDISEMDLNITNQDEKDKEGIDFSTASNWAVEEIQNAISNNLTTVKSTNNFKKNITREEFCEIVMKLYDALDGKTISNNSNPFTDTNNKEVIRAYQAKIISGTSKTKFSPNNNLTREQLCVMIIRALDAAGVEYSSSMNYQKKYSDVDNLSSWSKSAVKVLNGYKIFNGTNKGLEPKGTVTKEVAIVLINRSFERFK